MIRKANTVFFHINKERLPFFSVLGMLHKPFLFLSQKHSFFIVTPLVERVRSAFLCKIDRCSIGMKGIALKKRFHNISRLFAIIGKLPCRQIFRKSEIAQSDTPIPQSRPFRLLDGVIVERHHIVENAHHNRENALNILRRMYLCHIY